MKKCSFILTIIPLILLSNLLIAQEGFNLIATMSGDSTGDEFSVVAGVGDVNADGYDDVIVGAPGGDYAKLFFGGTVFDTIPDLIFRDYKQLNCYFGCAITGDGDVNGDGYPDIIIGASSTWIGPSFPYKIMTTGAAYVYFGGPGIDTTADLTLIVGNWEESTGWQYGFGKSVAIPGDINGDGYDDFAISAPNDEYDAHGRVYIYFGGPDVDDKYDVLLEGEDHFDMFGQSISRVGDINMDGFDDVIIGAPQSLTYSEPGKAYLVYGGDEISLANSEVFTGDTTMYNYGDVVAGLGDVNGDEFPDFGIMADRYLRVISGKDKNLLWEIFKGSNWDGNFQDLCGGNINNDNYNDIIISLEDTSNDYAGKIEIYMGRSDLYSTPDYTIEGNTPYYGLGSSTTYIGRLDGDEKNYIGIGELYEGFPNTGRIFIYSLGKINSINERYNYIPEGYNLYQNYPNPFNSSTIIRYSLSQEEEVTLKIYDLLGRLITTLVNENKKAGEYEIHFNTESLPSGVYFCRLKAGNVILNNKLMLLK